MDIPRIHQPCHESWAGMTPRDGGRHCAACDKVVVDIAALLPSVAVAHIANLSRRIAAGERFCVHSAVDSLGHLSPRPARRRLLTGGLAAVLAMSFVGCTGPEHAWQELHSMTTPLFSEPTATTKPVPINNLDVPVEEFSREEEPADCAPANTRFIEGDVTIEPRALMLGGISPLSDDDAPTGNG